MPYVYEGYPDILAWVNTEREARGLPTIAELPKGIRGSSCQCTVARALQGSDEDWLSCGSTVYSYVLTGGTIIGGAVNRKIPVFVQRFILDFDMGNIPELIER